jgi:alkylation response protein AidB-like acyl-CoA dehydrogenase
MKFLSSLAELQISARGRGDRFVLDGKLPWITNLRPQGFHVAVAAARQDGGAPFVLSLAHDDPGLVRSADLDLTALRASNTAAIDINGVEIGAERIIYQDAAAALPVVRPAFFGLQCGMSIGLTRRALAEARTVLGAGRDALSEPLAALVAKLAEQERRLLDGLRTGAFASDPAALFHLRIELADSLAQAIGRELQATEGRALLKTRSLAFNRRWRESAFIPIVTPSLLQLKMALAAEAEAAA